MTKNNGQGNNGENKKNEKCTCGICTGEGIGSILNMLTGGMMMMSGELPCSDPECKKAKCQSHLWKKEDKVDADILFEDGKDPMLRVKLPHHRKVEALISLREQLAEAQTDQIVWEKIVNDHITEENNKSIFEQLSDSSKAWLKDSAMKALSAARRGGKSGKKVIKEVTALDVFIEVMSGKKTYKNEAFNDKLKKICDIAIQSDGADIQEEIDKITAELPEELREATEIPTLSILLEQLESIARQYNSK